MQGGRTVSDSAVIWRPVWQGAAIPETQKARTAQAVQGVENLQAKLAAAGFKAQTWRMRQGQGIYCYGVSIRGRRPQFQQAQALCPSRGRVVPEWGPTT